MRHLSGFTFALLTFCSLACAQTSQQNAAHGQEWEERHQQYLPDPTIRETTSILDITANYPRPLDSVLEALVHQHGWHINYEDPHYGKADLVDDTAPQWLQKHPNGPRAYGVAGGAFSAHIPVDGRFPDDPMQVLPALVNAYDQSGNPGQFQLRVVGNNTFDVVPNAASDGPQVPLLDTVMSFDAKDLGVFEALTKFCQLLSRQSGVPVVFFGSGDPLPQGLFQARITQHSVNLPAREIVRQMYEQTGSTICWRLLYDPDSKKFLLLMRPAW